MDLHPPTAGASCAYNSHHLTPPTPDFPPYRPKKSNRVAQDAVIKQLSHHDLCLEGLNAQPCDPSFVSALHTQQSIV